MRILFATTVVPFARETGGEVISDTFVEALEELGCHVIVAGYLRPDGTIPVGRQALVVDRRPVETATAGVAAAGWMAKALVTRRPYVSVKFSAKNYGPVLQRSIESERIDAVIIDHTQLSSLLQWIPQKIPIAVIMHNAESKLYAQISMYQRSTISRFLYRREARQLRVLEHGIASRASRIWTLSESDRSLIASIADERLIAVVPAMPDYQGRFVGKPDARFDIGLLGTWSWQPNEDGLRWFLDEVYPRLPSNLSIHVAGRGADSLGSHHGNITYRGHVEDAAQFMREARVVAVPTRFGSGVETKMLMAIACGCAIVATSTAARGLMPVPESVCLADDAEGFVAGVVDALQPRPRHTHVEASQKWRAARRRNFLDSLRRQLGYLRASNGSARLVAGDNVAAM